MAPRRPARNRIGLRSAEALLRGQFHRDGIDHHPDARGVAQVGMDAQPQFAVGRGIGFVQQTANKLFG